MTLEETRSVVESYLADRGGHWLAEDVDLVDVAAGESFTGRRHAAEHLARVCPARSPLLTTEDGRAAVEWESGSAAVFEVEAGEIVAARLYRRLSGQAAGSRQGDRSAAA